MKKILVIEDNDNNMELICFILEASSYKVLKAYRGQDGVDIAFAEKPDLILLDIQLPDMDGLEVLRLIRGNAETENLRIIAVTSYAMSGDSKKLIDAGCNGYIEKPIDTDTFLPQLEQVLSAP